MFIAKTQLDQGAVALLGKQLFSTKRTHNNPLVALQYMVDPSCDEHTAVRQTRFDSIVKYTFCWPMKPRMFNRYMSPALEILIEEVKDNEGESAYVVFFTGSVQQWVNYCLNESHPTAFRDEVRERLSRDGYSLLFKEDNRRLK